MIKKLLLSLMIILPALSAWATAPTIDEAVGWVESAYVKWQPVADADSYNVYYSGAGITDSKIDNQLIRSYGTYYRADVLGLAAGSYTLKVVPVIAGVEGDAAVTTALAVEAHDRTGFAFSNGRVPGAYKADGTPKSGAVIIYITQNTKNTVSFDVTGATTNPCVGLQTILDGFKKGNDSRPLIIRLVGQITDLSYMLNGDIVIENNNNASSYITFEGVGDDAVADGWGIRIKNASNIEVRNIGTMNCDSGEGDNVGLQQGNDYIWVHHCDFFYGDAGGDADQAKGDGALDCKKSTNVTFSYNHFWDSGKSNLLGLSEGASNDLLITYHHNWYDHSDSRHPRVRFYSAHVYNNYYDGNSKYGVGATEGSSVFVEGNYFRNCKYPMLTSMQGSDVFNESTNANDYGDMPTFSKEDGGTIKAYDNYMEGQRRFVAYGSAAYANSTTDFDAYVATSRNETVANTVISARGSNVYNNFDTNTSVMYTYTADSPEEAKTKVMTYAGRIKGGDLKWTFVNATDDASYAVNAALKQKLTTYTTSLIAIQGDGAGSTVDTGDNTNTDGTVDTGGNNGSTGVVDGDAVHNFTEAGKTSTFYTISGNLSTSKGTETYEGLTLTQCLKIESATTISFTMAQGGVVTLVFNSSFSGGIKIDDVSYAASAGIVTQTIAAGSHQLTKDDSANLYYMSIAFDNTGNTGTTGDTTGNTDTTDNTGTTDNTTSIEEVDVPTLVMYPNPAIDQLNIASEAEVERIDIYNLTGALVKRITNNAKSIDVSDMNTGCYVVVIQTNKGIFRQRIIKK